MSNSTEEAEAVARALAVGPTRLKDVVVAVTRVFIEAKASMDELSAETSRKYQQSELLSGQPLPFFALSDVSLQLKVALQERADGDVIVVIAAEALAKLPPHVLTQIDMKLTPQAVRTYQGEDGKPVVFRES